MKRLVLLTDLNGVWYYRDKKVYRKLTKRFLINKGLSVSKFEKLDETLWPKLKKKVRKGKISYDKALEIFFKHFKKHGYKKLAKDYIKFEESIWSKYFRLNKNSKRVLASLKSKGIVIVGISDSVYSLKRIKKLLKKLGIGKYFDKVYTSNYLKLEKPEAFKLILKRFDKNLVVFLGHDDDEILGAKKFGIKTIGLKNRNADFYIKNISEVPKIILKIKQSF